MTLYSRKRGVVSRFDSVNRVYFDIQIEYLFSYSQLCSSEFSRLRSLQFLAGAFVCKFNSSSIPSGSSCPSISARKSAFVSLCIYSYRFEVWVPIGSECTSLLLYEPYANVSSQICNFLAVRPQFHSKNRVNLSTHRYCQSDTFGRLTFCVYPLLFTEFAFNVATPTAHTPRPPRKPLCGKIGLHAEL